MGRPRKEINPAFATRVKEARKILDLTQEQFAEAIHVTVIAVVRWENGYANVSDSCLLSIEKYAASKGKHGINCLWLKGVDVETIINTSRSILSNYPPPGEQLPTVFDLYHDERLEAIITLLYSSGHKVEEIKNLYTFMEYMKESANNSIEFYLRTLNKE